VIVTRNSKGNWLDQNQESEPSGRLHGYLGYNQIPVICHEPDPDLDLMRQVMTFKVIRIAALLMRPLSCLPASYLCKVELLRDDWESLLWILFLISSLDSFPVRENLEGGSLQIKLQTEKVGLFACWQAINACLEPGFAWYMCSQPAVKTWPSSLWNFLFQLAP